MSPKKTVELLGLLIVFTFTHSSNAQTNITADLGQDVILPCTVPNNKITAAEWRRSDQDPEYVLFYRDGHLDPDSQHPSYQNRVDLQDKEMKDGDVSLILKNVTMEDNGTFECWVHQGRKKELISTINLEVVEPGDQDGDTGDGGNKDGVLVIFSPPLVTAVMFMFVIGHVGSVIYHERRPRH
ncbi:ICOS ligand-like isoform X1 [Acanthochromis polyacanthus]|uniref:ICOS ligand-like isoform X1 n=1 Tax=Acanthochromis polyacanthus TaxID=80966 RepID=UPI002234171B|nr:ICOS ligand-like isoform X1 [Acanthochromis polyacanthus]